MQGIQVNVFDGQLGARTVGPILTAAALGPTDPHPVGRLITRAGEAVGLHERFQQINRMAVLARPIDVQTANDPAQHMTAQMRHARPGPNQEASVVGEQMQMTRAPRGVPAEIAVARGALPGGGAPEHTGKGPTVTIADQVLQMLAPPTAVTQVMMLREQRGEEGAVVRVANSADFSQVEREQRGQRLGDRGPGGGEVDSAGAERSRRR